MLVEHRPRALSKAELLARIWPSVFVADDSLAKVVSQLRKAIGDNDSTPIVRTVHGYGYAFISTVDIERVGQHASPAGRPLCWIFCGDREYPLHDGEHFIGRDADVVICLDSPNVSRRHAKIVVEGTRVTLEDLGSKNGSIVRGVRIAAPTRLESGDEACIVKPKSWKVE